MDEQEQKQLGADIATFLKQEAPASGLEDAPVKPERVNFKTDDEHAAAQDAYVTALLRKPDLTIEEQRELQRAIARFYR